MTPDTPRAREGHSILLPLLAVALFVPLFVWRRMGPLGFWEPFAIAAASLTILAVGLDRTFFPFLREDIRTQPGVKIVLGALSAFVLLLVFMAGNATIRTLFPEAGRQIGSVYALGAGVPRLRIVLLLLLLIGPGEELFWRGYLQRAWQARFSARTGWLLAAGLYAAVHVFSGNPVLILAAALCGLYWGALFLGFRSPLMLCVSHALWDILVFVVFPLTG